MLRNIFELCYVLVGFAFTVNLVAVCEEADVSKVEAALRRLKWARWAAFACIVVAVLRSRMALYFLPALGVGLLAEWASESRVRRVREGISASERHAVQCAPEALDSGMLGRGTASPYYQDHLRHMAWEFGCRIRLDAAKSTKSSPAKSEGR